MNRIAEKHQCDVEQIPVPLSGAGRVCPVGKSMHMAKAGIQDSDEDVLAYFERITRGDVARELGTTQPTQHTACRTLPVRIK